MRLRAEGVPEGTWLIQIDHALEGLRVADRLLRDLRDAIMEQARRNLPLIALLVDRLN